MEDQDNADDQELLPHSSQGDAESVQLQDSDSEESSIEDADISHTKRGSDQSAGSDLLVASAEQGYHQTAKSVTQTRKRPSSSREQETTAAAALLAAEARKQKKHNYNERIR